MLKPAIIVSPARSPAPSGAQHDAVPAAEHRRRHPATNARRQQMFRRQLRRVPGHDSVQPAIVARPIHSVRESWQSFTIGV